MNHDVRGEVFDATKAEFLDAHYEASRGILVAKEKHCSCVRFANSRSPIRAPAKNLVKKRTHAQCFLVAKRPSLGLS